MSIKKEQAKNKKTGIIPSENKTQHDINKNLIHNNSFYVLCYLVKSRRSTKKHNFFWCGNFDAISVTWKKKTNDFLNEMFSDRDHKISVWICFV